MKCLALSLGLLASTLFGQAQVAIHLETPQFRYTIGADGRNVAFVDRATGTNYLAPSPPSPCALIRRDGREFPATQVALDEGRLTLRFGDTGVDAVVRVESRPRFVRLTVESVTGGTIEALTFLNVPLTLRGQPDEPFGACAYSLNLQTRVDQLPALQSELRAACQPRFGLVGAKAAIVAVPTRDMLAALKEVLTEADELPLCKVAGPWAQEIPFNHGSYLFNFGGLTEATVDDWIAMARSLGVTQIDNHGGSAAFFRFGDFALNREKWPQGWDTFARIVARLRAADIGSIFHTYAFFIDKQSKYVTPVPDPRLDAFRTFTLAEAIGAEADQLRVNESTAGMSTVTGFFEYNSVVLQLGDELVTFGGVSAQAGLFTGLKRGAFGTQPAAHPAGERARHLKECFGLFVPDVATSLFEEIAANHAEVVNRCGFDGLYLDAIDGSAILRGGDECWYWADKFVIEIQKRLKRPVGMEMSAMWHHFWQYRTRWQAWDFPRRGHQRFIDLHTASVNGGLLLPLHLGWWGFQSFAPPQVEPTYPEVIDYLGAKLIGWDAGISLAGAIDREQLRTVPLFRRAVDSLRGYETLRRAGAIDDRVKAALREPGQEFALVTNAVGEARFRRAHSDSHTVAVAEPWTLAWRATNPFAAQPLRFRLAALMSAAPYADTNAVVLADLASPGAAAWKASAAEGVTLTIADTETGAEPLRVTLTATNRGRVPRNAAWARWQRPFEPTLDLKDQPALGLWVEGDGSGALLAIRLESPRHIAYGAVADRYLPLDFTGRRLVALVETESARWSDYQWNDGKALYHVYREAVEFGAIDSVSVWCQNLPPGREVKCRLGPVKALPMRAATVKEPALTIDGATLVFPVELASGSWIEGNGPDDCRVYGAKGEPLGTVTPRGDWPRLRAGDNEVRFSCAPVPGPSPRGSVTLFSRGADVGAQSGP